MLPDLKVKVFNTSRYLDSLKQMSDFLFVLFQGGRNNDDSDRGKVGSSARPVHGTAGGSRMRNDAMPVSAATPPGEYNSK